MFIYFSYLDIDQGHSGRFKWCIDYASSLTTRSVKGKGKRELPVIRTSVKRVFTRCSALGRPLTLSLTDGISSTPQRFWIIKTYTYYCTSSQVWGTSAHRSVGRKKHRRSHVSGSPLLHLVTHHCNGPQAAQWRTRSEVISVFIWRYHANYGNGRKKSIIRKIKLA